MKTINLRLYSTLVLSLIVNILSAQDFEWNMGNTGSNPGERIIAIIDAGTIGTYDGISITGNVIDNNGNWGSNLPTKANFSCYINFSNSNYKITQSIKTANISLRLRQVSNSVIHLTADMPYGHKSAIVVFKVGEQNGISSITLGDANVIDNSGTLILTTPTYEIFLDGNVGIGTTTPDSKLTVKGDIHTQEVKVDLLGAVMPDYVFYKDYKLKTLTEIEQYINEKGHLPNIPSAKDAETNGLLLKEMNLKLLQKIEELTLYTIQQEKEIKTSKREITLLKNKAIKVDVLQDEVLKQKKKLQKIETLLKSLK